MATRLLRLQELKSAILVVSIAMHAMAGVAADDRVGQGSSATTEAPSRRSPLAYFKDNPLGSFGLTMRPRYEFAEQDDRRRSDGLTLRAALSLATRSYRGLSLFVEGEVVVSPKESLYFDGVSTPSRRTVIADPQNIDLNQLFLDYRSEFAKSEIRIGRQRMLLDDQRFIGNLGWRQNEMTMDAAQASSSLGIPEFKIRYAYLHKVRRPFGNRGDDSTRDFESSSHLVHAQYSGFDSIRLKAFAYLFDFDSVRPLSSQTYGVRLEGEVAIRRDLEIIYVLSYAHQWDAAENPLDYDANYQLVRLGARDRAFGRLTLGFERLGSDAGNVVFRRRFRPRTDSTASRTHSWTTVGPKGCRTSSSRSRPSCRGA